MLLSNNKKNRQELSVICHFQLLLDLFEQFRNNQATLRPQIFPYLIRCFSAGAFDLGHRPPRFTIKIHKYLAHIYVFVLLFKNY